MGDALDEPDPQSFHRLRRRPARQEPIRHRREVGLEDRFQHELRGGLRHPVANRRDAQRPPATIWFRDVHPPGRRRTIRSCAELAAQFGEHPLHAVVLHRDQSDPIHPCRTPIAADPFPRLPQDVTPVDTVIQGVETPTRGLLGRSCRVRITLRPAILLPPKRLSTPRSAHRVSTTNRGLTRTGLSPAGLGSGSV